MIKATYINHMGSDISVVNAARVSFGKKSGWEYDETDAYNQKRYLPKADAKLIHYLAKHKHMSPFGHCFATFHVKAPIFVARQLVKHKFLRWNEISRRYVDERPEFYVPDVWRGPSEDKKQGSDGVVEVLEEVYTSRLERAVSYYMRLINVVGVCPEQARIVLPQATMTEWYWSGSLDAFSDMCVLRCASDTQAETQEVANQISHKMHELFPVSWMALAKGRH